MSESGDIALDYILSIVEGVRAHWEYLSTPYYPLGFEPAPFYRRWVEQYFGADTLVDEGIRREVAAHGGQGLAVAGLIPELWDIWCERHSDPDADALGAAIRSHAAWGAWVLAVKAIKEPLSDAELNGLGWHLTTLAAVSGGHFRKTLCQMQRKAGQKGGMQSASARRVEFAARAAQTCKMAAAILASRSCSPADLVRILVSRTGLSAPTIKKHLRTAALYPEEKKRKLS